MKLQIMSDLHLEMHRDNGKEFCEKDIKGDPDTILVIAGDLTDGAYAREALDMLADKFKHVIYVPGNHEYYGHTPSFVDNALLLSEKCFPNVTVPMNEILILDKQRFLCGTMWFKESAENNPYKQHLNDFNMIVGFEPWVYQQNTAFEAFLRRHLRKDDIVITHHLPSERCTPKDYAHSSLNRFFVNDCEKLILERDPKLWIHGHTHSMVDLTIGSTWVVANPVGYPGEVNYREVVIEP